MQNILWSPNGLLAFTDTFQRKDVHLYAIKSKLSSLRKLNTKPPQARNLVNEIHQRVV